MFENLVEVLKANPRKIVYTEGTDARILENLGAAEVMLTDAEYAAMNEALAHITIHGNRTDEDIAKLGTIEGNQQKVAKAER